MIRTNATATAREIETLTGATEEIVSMGEKGITDLETVSGRGTEVMKRETDTTDSNVMVEELAVLKNDHLVVDEGTKKKLHSLLSLCTDIVTEGRGMMNPLSLRSP